VLADIADYQARLPDPAQLRATETGLREAITTDPPSPATPSPAGRPQPGSWPGPPCNT
jgi:hypothetical protein